MKQCFAGKRNDSVMESTSFWKEKISQNRYISLPYQWERYEENGTIDNFRIAAGLKTGFRRGFFYTDSDLHKWADAVCRTLAAEADPKLEELFQLYLELMTKSQEDDGYIYTFNQINFPGSRWENLLVEHELYCMGHFIEAGIEHAGWTGGSELLDLAEKTAKLICRDFEGTRLVPGHQEVEYALLRLSDVCCNNEYKEAALNFLYNRGRGVMPAYSLIRDFNSHQKKIEAVKKINPENQSFSIDDADLQHLTVKHKLRNLLSYLNGQYMQRNRPVAGQTDPKGHAVRWAYQMAAAAASGEGELAAAARTSWKNMVAAKMYISGGVGALPLIEGFGKAFELPNKSAYCETCAAVGSIFLANELFSLRQEAVYMDVLEWQLYNAAMVGLGSDGTSYFYANPLASDGGIERKKWFGTACCPSNISRLLGSLHRFAVQEKGENLYFNLYFGGKYQLMDNNISLNVQSFLPWKGSTIINIGNSAGKALQFYIRIPGWVESGEISVNGELTRLNLQCRNTVGLPDFKNSRYLPVELPAGESSEIRIFFEIPIKLLPADDRVRENRGRLAVYRGPILYCLEYDKNILNEPVLTTHSFEYEWDSVEKTGIITTMLQSGETVRLIPYLHWGNSDDPKNKRMRVWLKV